MRSVAEDVVRHQDARVVDAELATSDEHAGAAPEIVRLNVNAALVHKVVFHDGVRAIGCLKRPLKLLLFRSNSREHHLRAATGTVRGVVTCAERAFVEEDISDKQLDISRI
eukprot:scaffold49997_cov59-Phaeocystis_antarctica.AAC.4